MIFNDRYQLTKVFEPLSQEEILQTPEFYAMSLESILKSGKCPEHLKKVLLGFNWKGRPTVIQVRPQDFRIAQPPMLGTGWHVDCNTHLRSGRNQIAKSLDEFALQTVSFGDVTETQFIADPFELDTNLADPFQHVAFHGAVSRYVELSGARIATAKPNQLAEYTSHDVHRVSPTCRIGNARLIIVAYECDEAIEENGGSIGLSILQKGN